MTRPQTALLHYSSPPVVGGVEAVIQAQAAGFLRAGYPLTVVTGRGERDALPNGADLILIPEMDSLYPQAAAIGRALSGGKIPDDFEAFTASLLDKLEGALDAFDVLIVHNVFTKHFNLPLTAALERYLGQNESLRCIAWCHDFTWTSSHSRPLVHDGYPWDLLRRRLPRTTYVTVSAHRRRELADLFECPEEAIHVVYNGVDASVLYGLSERGRQLAERLDLFDCDLSLLMPVRVTEAKNIEYGIRLAAALKERGTDARIILTGPPDPHEAMSMSYFDSLRTLRRQLGVEREMRFVFESGPDADRPFRIGMETVAELYRVCDLLFMPSHREGFGMPILEAGLLGMPIVASTQIPAAQEIGREAVLRFDPVLPPAELAGTVLGFLRSSPNLRLRAEVRRTLTWQAIFRREIEPLIVGHPRGATKSANRKR